MRLRKRPVHNTQRDNLCPLPRAYEYEVGTEFRCECGIEYKVVVDRYKWWKPTNTTMLNGISVPISGHPVYVPTAALGRAHD